MDYWEVVETIKSGANADEVGHLGMPLKVSRSQFLILSFCLWLHEMSSIFFHIRLLAG